MTVTAGVSKSISKYRYRVVLGLPIIKRSAPASLGVWPLGDLPGVCVRRALPLLGPVALGPRVLTSRLPPTDTHRHRRQRMALAHRQGGGGEDCENVSSTFWRKLSQVAAVARTTDGGARAVQASTMCIVRLARTGPAAWAARPPAGADPPPRQSARTRPNLTKANE